MSEQSKATRKGGAKTDAERQDEKRKRDEATTGFKQLNVKCHKDDHEKVRAFVKKLNEARGA